MSAEGSWVYEHGDYELLLLDQIVQRGFAANVNVDYAMNYGRPSGVEPYFVESGTGRPGLRDRAPHLEQEPLVITVVGGIDGVFELPEPVLGRPVIRSSSAPVVCTGESLEETLTTQHESRHDVVERSPGVWTTVHELGFRFVRVDASVIEIEARVRPGTLQGSFECSNRRLTQIWQTSARTLRLCMQGLMLDGVKRDRMPWIGDQALTMLANAYSFADGAIIRDSLVALGRPRHGYVNGIADYSLWWLITARQYQLYFDDREFLGREADNIDAFLSNLAGYVTDGVFRPRPEPDGFEGANEGSVFIDWGAVIEPGRDYTALQVLWCWAVRSGAELLANHPSGATWAALANSVEQVTIASGWHGERWSEYLDDATTTSPYPNFLAKLAGLPTSETAMKTVTDATRLGTPFMTAFAIAAVGASALPRIEQLWGAMLDAGATTFWEEFAEDSSPLEMYGRPFGKSLCHAWSSGPAALLPQLVLGVRPLTDGWATFTVEPQLGDLAWASAVVPTPHGDIIVHSDRSRTTVTVPAGTALGEHLGPCTVTI